MAILDPIPSFYVYYEIKSYNGYFADKDIDKQEEFIKIKDIFSQLLRSTSEPHPKILIDEKNLCIRCGYQTSKEFKAAFPNCKELINISKLCNSKHSVIKCIASLSTEYRQVLGQKAEEEKIALKKECQEFNEEMEAFLTSHSFTEAPLVNTTSCQSPQDLIKLFLTNFTAFGIGDSHYDLSTYHFINDNLRLFKELGVTTIFWEGFPEHIESAVKKYFNPSNPIDHFPNALQDFIAKKDEEVVKKYWDHYDHSLFPQVTKEFFQQLKKNDMRLCTLEYRRLSEATIQPGLIMSIDDDILRMKQMNYSAYKILTQFQNDHPGEKFIFFDGAWHNSQYDTIPGIATLFQCPWILVADSSNKESKWLLEHDSVEAQELIKKIYSSPDPEKYSMRPDAVLRGDPFPKKPTKNANAYQMCPCPIL